MSINAALKAVRNAIDSKNFDVAADKAKAVLANDADNYHANVFLGLASDKLQKNVDSENAYLAATRTKPTDPVAWKGLISLYKKIGRQKLDAYHDAVLKYGKILSDRDERNPCLDLVNKYTDLARNSGTVDQKKKALELQLPSSPLYSFLEGGLLHPSLTYLRLIEITEADEKEYINTQIGERRTRLGARIDQVTLEVKREAFKRSALQDLYEGIINWTNDDAVRREYEEKIIKRGCEELEVLPVKAKKAKRQEILRLAKEMVLIKHPYEQAWNIVLEWNDIESYKEWDVGVLREFIEFFPDSGLAKVLKGFLESDLSPFPPEEKPKDEDQEPSNVNESEGTESPARKESEAFENNDMSADQLILMAEGLELARYSIVAHRIMADLYLSLEEYETTVDIARKGLLNVEDRVKATGLNATNTTDSLNVTLANSLIYYQSPRHHPEAKGIFEKILQRKPTSTNCLLGVGLILKSDEDYPNAVDFLQRAQERDESNITIRGELSWCKALSGDFETGIEGLQDALDRLITEKPQDKDFKGELYYRIGYCQWELDPSPTARKDRNGAYASFLAAIKSNMNFAPAYTSLGFYYADYKKDKTRARRCFQKAFELSSAEITAAERLARAFANKQEWDLVEAVSKRVVDSGRAKPAPGSKRRGFSWPYAALGTVQVSRQQYAASIVSFQAALRITPEDYHSWVGLAESYHHSGRYIAATKAFEHAQELEQYMTVEEKQHIWFARYMLANVRRELGQHDLAIECYESILRDKPNDVGNTVALLQTLTESSWKNLHTGLFNSAAELAAKAIKVAQPLAEVHSNIFNMWKAVGDACATFSYIKIKSPMLPVSACKTLLTTGLDPVALDIMTNLDGVGADWLTSPESEESSSDSCVYLAILAYKRAIHVSANDSHAQAVGWYNLGWAEYRAYRSVQAATGSKDKRNRKYIKAAMRCFKRAIELEAGNAEFWNSLGVVTAGMSPRVSQHAFVRSLHLDDRNVQVWTNLGALYLIQGDVPLANQALIRAQSTDPDYALAWIGQAIIALLYGSRDEARGLFAHAFEISQSSDMLPKGQYVLSLFDHLVSDSSASNEVSQLIQPFFALHQLCAQDPSHLPFVHLSALLAERMGETADAESSLEFVCSGMEAEYDQSESESSLLKFAQANADFARILLAQHEYEQAAEKAETALTLTADDGAGDVDPETCTKLRLSAQLTAGLAYYFTKSMDQAIDMFRDALQEATNSPDVVCLLAQVLWAKGGEDERSVARQQLLDCVENHPDHVGAVILLGAIALLDDDEDVIGAVESDLHNMIATDDVDIHDRAKLLKLLSAISAKGLNENADVPEDMRQIKESTAAIMMSPGQPQGWMELSAVSESSYPAEMAIERALKCVPPHGNLEASDLSQADCQTGKISDAFRSIMVAPWKREGWDQLDHSVSTEAA